MSNVDIIDVRNLTPKIKTSKRVLWK